MTRLSLPLRSITFLLLSLLLCGCVDIREEYWVEPDGSGRLRSVVSFLSTPDQSAEIRRLCAEARDEYAGHPLVEDFEFSDDIRDGLHHFVVDVRVAHYRILDDVHDRLVEARRSFLESEDARLEACDLTLDGLTSCRFEKQLPVGRPPRDNPEADPSGEGWQGLIRQQLSRRAFRVVLHAPGEIRGNGQHIEDGTMAWAVPMDIVFGDEMTVKSFNASFNAPADTLLWGSVALAVLGMGSLGWWVRRRRRSLREK